MKKFGQEANSKTNEKQVNGTADRVKLLSLLELLLEIDKSIQKRITTDQYEDLRGKWNKEKKEYEDRLTIISKADEDYYITATKLLELASRSYELFLGSEPEQKRQLITLTLQNLTIKDGKLQYEWIKPFDSIFISAGSHSWGGGH